MGLVLQPLCCRHHLPSFLTHAFSLDLHACLLLTTLYPRRCHYSYTPTPSGVPRAESDVDGVRGQRGRSVWTHTGVYYVGVRVCGGRVCGCSNVWMRWEERRWMRWWDGGGGRSWLFLLLLGRAKELLQRQIISTSCHCHCRTLINLPLHTQPSLLVSSSSLPFAPTLLPPSHTNPHNTTLNKLRPSFPARPLASSVCRPWWLPAASMSAHSSGRACALPACQQPWVSVVLVLGGV